MTGTPMVSIWCAGRRLASFPMSDGSRAPRVGETVRWRLRPDEPEAVVLSVRSVVWDFAESRIGKLMGVVVEVELGQAGVAPAWWADLLDRSGQDRLP